mgnify:CR=1 FL=1
MNKVNNGRVDIKTPNTSALFQMYDKIPANQCVTFRNATEGLWTSSPLSQAFFSQNFLEKIYFISELKGIFSYGYCKFAVL